MADEDRSPDFVAGQVHALIGFALAIIETHASPTLLQKHLDVLEQGALASTEATLLPDEFLNGQHDVFVRLKRRAAAALARRDRRHTPEGDREPQG